MYAVFTKYFSSVPREIVSSFSLSYFKVLGSENVTSTVGSVRGVSKGGKIDTAERFLGTKVNALATVGSEVVGNGNPPPPGDPGWGRFDGTLLSSKAAAMALKVEAMEGLFLHL